MTLFRLWQRAHEVGAEDVKWLLGPSREHISRRLALFCFVFLAGGAPLYLTCYVTEQEQQIIALGNPRRGLSNSQVSGGSSWHHGIPGTPYGEIRCLRIVSRGHTPRYLVLVLHGDITVHCGWCNPGTSLGCRLPPVFACPTRDTLEASPLLGIEFPLAAWRVRPLRCFVYPSLLEL